MEPVYIRAMALNCALGRDPHACVAAMRARRQNVARVVLDMFNEPLALSYYRLADDAELLDPGRMARLLPPVVEQAVAAADLTLQQRADLPVFLGSSCFSIAREEARYAQRLAGDHGAVTMSAGYDVLAELVQRSVGSRAATYTWNTACTAAANALLGAQRRLAMGHYCHALVVGVELANLTTLGGFSALQLIADRVQPFDAERRGIVLGEGIGAVVLSAEPGADNAPRLLGGASNCDTHSVTGANPDGRSVATVQTRALRAAGVMPERIRALKSHGTGTLANDAAEAMGMHQVFAQLPPVCALKPWLGHTMGASGINELILFAIALEQGVLPATAGFDNADPALDTAPLTHEMPAQPGPYLLNQFGFGGNNTALVVEQP